MTATDDENPYGVPLYPVISPSGAVLNLQTEAEGKWYEDKKSRYLADNVFTNVSDLQDLDRLLILEVFSYRWSLWVAQGWDYLYVRIDESDLTKKLKEYSGEIRLLKQSLGIDKSTRDKEKGESLADYTEKLLQRAKAFGYHRNQQYETAVTKMYHLRSILLTYDRCDEEERRQLGLSQESILEWIRTNMIQDWDKLAEDFRKNQAMWIRDQ